MKKNIFILIFFFLGFGALSHEKDYKDISKIEMDIYLNDKVIGYSNYYFTHSKSGMIVLNDTKFEVELFGEELESEDYSELIGHAQTEFEQLLETTVL